MIRPKEYIHPEDEAALRNMEAIPGFGTAIKLLLKNYSEQQYHGICVASKLRLSPRQLPRLYGKLPPLCERLSIREPEFYLEMNPFPNAYAFGDSRTIVCMTSGLLEYLTDEEVTSVLAHECGHIACRHMLYHTMAQVIVQFANNLGFLGNLALPVVCALQYWSRKSELSADRAAAIALGDAQKVVNVNIRLAAGPKHITQDVDVDEFIAQADYYDQLYRDDVWNKILQYQAIMFQTHPFSAVRVREILKWSRTEQYKRLLEGLRLNCSQKQCTKCGKAVDEDWKFCRHCGKKLK